MFLIDFFFHGKACLDMLSYFIINSRALVNSNFIYNLMVLFTCCLAFCNHNLQNVASIELETSARESNQLKGKSSPNVLAR